MRRLLLLLMTLGSFYSSVYASSGYVTGRWGSAWSPERLVNVQKNRPADWGKLKAIVVVSMGTDCPLVRRLVPSLNKMSREYEKKGVQFFGLFANAHNTLPEVTNYATEMNIHFPVFLDSKDAAFRWSNKLFLTKTPEVVVLDVAKGYDPTAVFYQGAIDDSIIPVGGKAEAHTPFLKSALDSIISGKKVKEPYTIAQGCKVAQKQYHDLSDYKDVTYYKDIAPLINQKCQRCHQEGDVAGESYLFEDYEDVANNFDTIIEYVSDRIMPPWHAYLNDKKNYHGFVNDMRLSDEQIKMLLAWGKAELPAGDKKDLPKLKKWPGPKDWKIAGGNPSFVYSMEEEYKVPQKKLDEYKYYRVPINFPEDRWIKEVQMRPGNASVVHHIGAIIAPSSDKKMDGHEATMELYGLDGEGILKVGDYVPGDPFNARVWPDGTALKLPKNSDIIFEMHYTPTGKAEESDRSSLGIVWQDKAPLKEIETKVFVKKRIHVPPYESHFEISRYYHFKEEVEISALAPHMHYRGKDFTLYKIINRGEPNEIREKILTIPAFDFNWQRTYELQKPIHLKPGEGLFGIGHIDNSPYNPHNPDPSVWVKWGLKSENEMFNMRVKYHRLKK